MKLPFLISLILLFNTALCQNAVFKLVVEGSDTIITHSPPFIELSLDSQEIFTGYISFNRVFSIEKLVPGMYKLTVRQIGMRMAIYDSLMIHNGQTRELSIAYPGPCRFIYPDGYKPKCPFGHTNDIIPIRYGLPGEKMMNKARKGKIYLGGCMVSDCDPQYYCRLHNIEI